VLHSLAELFAARGWQPPPAARRDGGLWLLTREKLAALPPPQMAAAAYGTPCFEPYFRCERALPVADCRRRAGGPLPAAALELVRAGMCCVLDGARLWPAAEDRFLAEDMFLPLAPYPNPDPDPQVGLRGVPARGAQGMRLRRALVARK